VPTGDAIVCYVPTMTARDSIEHVLDRLSDIREELLSLEREIERIAAARLNGYGEPDSASSVSLKIAL